MKTVKRKLALTIFISLVIASTHALCQSTSLVNFSHLNELMQEVRVEGRDVSIVHIYADYPEYKWTDAGDEGIACVDDGARAAVVYLRDYEIHRNPESLSRAKSLLRFVLTMETADGEFYNFINRDLTINRTGKTSLKSFGWWAGRAVWALSMGYRVLKVTDTLFAAELRMGVQKALPNVSRLLDNYGRTETIDGFKTTKWLLYESGSDATTELLLGLAEYYRATQDSIVAGYIRKLADGLMLMQDGDARSFPFGAHRSWRTMWHSWGNSQTCVLAYAGRLLDDSAMVASAEREASGFYSRLLIQGMLKEWDFTQPAKKVSYDQIAYDIRPMTLGLLRLFDATGQGLYLMMAGLSSSWLLGNNVLHQAMYDSTTGRCFDGIKDSTDLNRNSGAESTIEALYTFLEVQQYPLAAKYLCYRKTSERSTSDKLEATFRDEQGHQVSLILDLTSGSLEAQENR